VNDRIQIFGPEGEHLENWTDVTRPGDLFIDADDNVYIGEMYWRPGLKSIAGLAWPEEVPSRISVRDITGKVLSVFGGARGEDPCVAGNFTAPHGIWVDRRGDIYVGEVSQTSYERSVFYPGCHSLQKFRRV
jgi:hypothetical protein